MSGNSIKMIKQIAFTKMHGAGNDYMYVDTMRFPLEDPETLAIAWSKPHTGIGSDGLVLIGGSEKADFSMRIFNADGSEAKMCGNASRCVGKYVYEKGLTAKETVTLETLSGVKELKLDVEAGKVKQVTVNMGKPVIGETTLPVTAGGVPLEGTVVSMGNPHLVVFVDRLEAIDLSQAGPLLEHHTAFPDRTNVEFARILNNDTIRMRVWERGSGITQACGTGACATAVAAAVKGVAARRSTILMDGGPLLIDWDEVSDNVFMTGDATTVFEGTIEIESEQSNERHR